MINFEFNKDWESPTLTLADVMMDGFFVCSKGQLCQKVGDGLYNVIADSGGAPRADSDGAPEDTKIERIIGKPSKITF